LQDISGPNGTPDGVVDSYDITVIGDTNPDFSGGFGLNGTFYDFDFSANFTFTVGNDIYNANKIASSQYYGNASAYNMMDEMRQSNSYSYINPTTGTLITSLEDLAYYNEGGNGQSPKEYWSPFSFGNRVIMPTDWAMEDASFLRLQSVTIGYTLPTAITKKAGIQRLRFYLAAENLLTFTGYKDGFDPELGGGDGASATAMGVDKGIYPQSRTVYIGANITF
jgi:hypothetical protein